MKGKAIWNLWGVSADLRESLSGKSGMAFGLGQCRIRV